MTAHNEYDRSADMMADIIDEFAAIMEGADATVRRSVKYKANLLWVHALAALLMAPLFALTTKEALAGPAFYFVRQLPLVPHSFAAILGTGGFLLGIGAVFHIRKLQIAGLSLLGAWYFLFGISIAVPAVIWLYDESVARPPFYAPIVYLHLTIIMAIHVWGVLRQTKRG